MSFKKVLAAIFIGLISNANATWIEISENNSYSFFFDESESPFNEINRSRDSSDSPNSKRIYYKSKANIQSKWILINYSSSLVNGVKSSRHLVKLNCKNATYQLIATSYFSKAMADGDIITTSIDEKFLEPEIAKLLKLSCN